MISIIHPPTDVVEFIPALGRGASERMRKVNSAPCLQQMLCSTLRNSFSGTECQRNRRAAFYGGLTDECCGRR
ncbi:hypothetical protein niasHT_009776 [Heterodera trifolii]